MYNLRQKVQARRNEKVICSAWRLAAALPSIIFLQLLEAFHSCRLAGTSRPSGNGAWGQSSQRRVRGRLRPWRIAACAVAVFVVSLSLCSVRAQAAAQREEPGPIHLTKSGRKWVSATLRSLSLKEKIGQMLMGRCFLDYPNFQSPDYKRLLENLEQYHLGSLVVAVHLNQQGLERPSPLQAARVANQLQTDSKLPLLIAADLERGMASRLANVPDFPWPMAFGAAGNPANAERLGAMTAQPAVFPTRSPLKFNREPICCRLARPHARVRMNAAGNQGWKANCAGIQPRTEFIK